MFCKTSSQKKPVFVGNCVVLYVTRSSYVHFNFHDFTIFLFNVCNKRILFSGKSRYNYLDIMPYCNVKLETRYRVDLYYTRRHVVPFQQVHEHAVLISDGTSRHDMRQGDLNDCWFLSTLSAIAEKPQLMSKVRSSTHCIVHYTIQLMLLTTL